MKSVAQLTQVGPAANNVGGHLGQIYTNADKRNIVLVIFRHGSSQL